jgi:hypothetical protein
MDDEEWELYVRCCEQLGIVLKQRSAPPVPADPMMPVDKDADGNVVQMFAQDRIGIPEGGQKGSIDPRVGKKIKNSTRLGKRWSEIIIAVDNKEYTWDEFCAALTPEELARGQLMSKDGDFVGRPPSFVPRAFHDACIRELLGRGRQLYKENYIKAIEAMTGIAESKTAKEADRIKAATFVIERLEGKVPDKLEVSVADPWQQIISGIVAEADDEMVANAQEYLSRVRPEGNE